MWFLLGAGAPQQPRGLQALPAFARILASAHAPVLPLLQQGQDQLDVSLAVSAGDRAGVPVSCGDRTPQGSGLGTAGSARPRAASCAINDKAAAELCLCPAPCVSQGCLCLPWLSGWLLGGFCAGLGGSRAMMAARAQPGITKPMGFVPACSVSVVMASVPPRAYSLLQPLELPGAGLG